MDEPHLYGPLGLVDAASRLIDVARLEGKTEELDRPQRTIDEGKRLAMSMERSSSGSQTGW